MTTILLYIILHAQLTVPSVTGTIAASSAPAAVNTPWVFTAANPYVFTTSNVVIFNVQ